MIRDLTSMIYCNSAPNLIMDDLNVPWGAKTVSLEHQGSLKLSLSQVFKLFSSIDPPVNANWRLHVCPLHLAVNKSAGNPLQPFLESLGSAFWELPPAGQRVSRERMPEQTGTQRTQTETQRPAAAHKCPRGISDTRQCPSIVFQLAAALGNVGGIRIS